jgi:antagonist of KipI
MDGPQADMLATAPFYTYRFQVTEASNRMGVRLTGAPLVATRLELLSEPVCPGTVQLTPDERCLVLGVDGQTIGGYPKVAQVISADLDQVGQLRPGDQVQFIRVSLAEAERIFHQKAKLLTEWLTRLQVTFKQPAPSKGPARQAGPIGAK